MNFSEQTIFSEEQTKFSEKDKSDLPQGPKRSAPQTAYILAILVGKSYMSQ